MNRYSMNALPSDIHPDSTLVSLEKEWTAIVPDEPVRAKGIVKWNLTSTTPRTFAVAHIYRSSPTLRHTKS